MKIINYALLVIVIAISSCAGNANNQANNLESSVLTVDELFNNAENLSDKTIIVKGTVTHVCRHGGQRLFVIGDNPDKRLKITTGTGISQFKVELEGSSIEITGQLDEERIDEEYLNQWETEVLSKEEEGHNEGMGIHDGNHVNNNQEEIEKINDYREQIKASGKGYLSFYSVVCESYKEI